MSSSIHTLIIHAPSAEGLLGKLQQELLTEPRLCGFNPDLQPKKMVVETYVLIFGPPGGEDRVVLFRELPQGVVVLGGSIDLACTQADGKMRGEWGALIVRSPYITPVVSFVNLAPDQDSDDALQDFLGKLGDEYFNLDTRKSGKSGRPSHRINGAGGVVYRRPAYLLMLLPGTGFTQNAEWPEGNVDYQIVNRVAELANPDLTIFGYSVTSRLAKDSHPAGKSWMFSRNRDGIFWQGSSGAVAMLVQSDLAFGCASANGFSTSPKEEPCNVKGEGATPETIVFKDERGRRKSFHSVQLSDPLRLLDQVWKLERHTDGNKGPRPFEEKNEWITLGLYEGEEFIPNPAYQENQSKGKKGQLPAANQLRFLLPLTAGTPLFLAKATRASMLAAGPAAINRACEKGVTKPVLAVMANCRGRHWCLGSEGSDDNSVSEEVERVKELCPKISNVLGLYADGETSPTIRNVGFHRNWSAAALVLGQDFDPAYLSAARTHNLAKIDEARHHFKNPDDLLKLILRSAIALTQAGGGHIRMMPIEGTGQLLKRCAEGAFSNEMPDSLDPDDKASDLSVESYQTRKFVSKKGVKAEVLFPKPTAKQIAICTSIQRRLGQPIIAGSGEVLGVLSLNSEDENFFDETHFVEIKEILDEITRKTASVLKAQMLTHQFNESLKCFAGEPSISDVISHGAKLLSPHAVLMLMLPSKDGKVLKCNDCYPRKDDRLLEHIGVSIDESSRLEDQGIAGYAYLHPDKVQVWDDVSKANGVNGPKFMDCLGQYYIPTLGRFSKLEQNYAVAIYDPKKPDEKPMGVLIAEAPSGVLNREDHLEMLQTIAEVCKKVLTQTKQRNEFKNCLGTLLPMHVVDDLMALKDQENPTRIPGPSLRRTTILNADIRGYTKLSEIVGDDKIIEFQTAYFQMITRAVERHGGNIDKFMGDGVMALFDQHTRKEVRRQHEERTKNKPTDGGGLPTDHHDIGDVPDEIIREDVKASVEAGFEIANEFDKLAKKWLPVWRRKHPAILQKYPLTIGVAVHCGRPICGLWNTEEVTPGADITKLPQKGHTTYTAIGRDANLGARVCSVTDKNTVWVTAPCWELLKDCESYDQSWENVLRLDPDNSQAQPDQHSLLPKPAPKLKGISHSIDIFQVLPSKQCRAISQVPASE